MTGLALGWIFSSSVFLNNSVKVVSNAFDFEKDQNVDDRVVSFDFVGHAYSNFISLV